MSRLLPPGRYVALQRIRSGVPLCGRNCPAPDQLPVNSANGPADCATADGMLIGTTKIRAKNKPPKKAKGQHENGSIMFAYIFFFPLNVVLKNKHPRRKGGQGRSGSCLECASPHGSVY